MNFKVASGRKCFATSSADVFLWSLSGGRDRDGGRRDDRHRIVVIIVAGGGVDDRSRPNWLWVRDGGREW